MGNTNENYNYKIYAHVNKVNEKIYIGQTKQKVEDRLRDGLGYKPYGKNLHHIFGMQFKNMNGIILSISS